MLEPPKIRRMQKLLNIIVFFTLFTSFSQEKEVEKESESFLFEKRLRLETNKDSITNHLKIINEILVIAEIDSLNSDSKWELLYLHKTGWEESMPNKKHFINNLYMGKPNNIVTCNELLNVFKISNQKEILLNQFPPEFTIEPRGAPLNGKWTIIFLKNNHLTLQYIHSYPNGNQSSWFRKTNYYFKTIN